MFLITFSNLAQANEQWDYTQCVAREPLPPLPQNKNLQIDANSFQSQDSNLLILEGQVSLRQSGALIETDRLEVFQEQQNAITDAPLLLRNAFLSIQAESGAFNWKTEQAQLNEGLYTLQKRRGQGHAQGIRIENKEKAQLTNFSFTTCDLEQPSWLMEARSVDLDFKSGKGVARNAKLKIQDVTVLYSPYLSFPLDERRQSGFLLPNLEYNKDTGLDMSLPWYWNIAPNMDATFTPRILTERGLMLGAEYRYLWPGHRGTIQGAFLPDDSIDDINRYQLDLFHQSQLGENWKADVRWFDVSDANFYRDFGHSPVETVLSFQRSRAQLRGNWQQGYVNFMADQYTLLDQTIPERDLPWRRLPALEGQWAYDFKQSGFEAGLYSEWVKFDHDILSGGERLDIQPWLSWEFWQPGSFFRAQTRWRHTAYQLDDGRELSRDLPIISLDTGLIFEKVNDKTTHTLEPRLFALYVPEKSQEAFPVFDTTEPQFSFQQLFRSNQFVGADRQSDAQNITLAISSRWFNHKTGQEQFSVHVGQIYYLEAPTVSLNAGTEQSSQSPVAFEIDGRLANGWLASAGLIHDLDQNISEQSSFRLRKRWDNDALFQISYRQQQYTREQIDLFGQWPVSPKWSLLARYNYSLQSQQNLDSLLGVAFESCCLSTRLVFRRYTLDDTGSGQQRNAIFLEIGLKGLGSFGRRSERLLERSIYGRF